MTVLAAVPVLFSQATLLHWAALLAFCTFLGFQLCLFYYCRRALLRQRRVLVALRAERRVPEQPFTRSGIGSEWLEWVATRYHDGGFHDGHYSREHALEQLDDCLGSVGSYRLLQRTGIVAPMVGLLLTVAGFLSVDLPAAADWDLKQIIQTLVPIILGVGTGALLAIINLLVLLPVLEKRTDSLRSSARAWFDECVWKHVQVKPHLAANDVAEALQEMGATIRGSIEQYRGATAAIGQTSQFLRDAGTALVNTAERLSTDTRGIPDEMRSLRDMASGVIRLLGDIVPNIERTTAEFAETAGALKSVVQVPLAQAAARQQESAESFARSVERIGESTEQLSARLGSLDKTMSDQAAAGREWSRSLHEDVIPAQRAFRQVGAHLTDATKDLAAAQRAFREAADSMQGSANGLAGFVRDGVEPATQRLAELDQVLTRMRETTEAVRQMTQLRQEFAVLARSLSQAAAAADAIRSLPQEIRAILQTVVPSRNSNTGPRRPFYLRLFGIGRRSNGKP
jgi:hypothetical protein